MHWNRSGEMAISVDPKDIRVGDYVKARFWPGERIWAQVCSICDGSVDAILDNDPAPAEYLPPEVRHMASKHKAGDFVSCGMDEIIEAARPDGDRDQA
jgi:hypothetical protein